MVHKLVLNGTGPGVGLEIPNIPAPKAAEVAKLATSAEGPNFEAMRTLFFYPTESSRATATERWAPVQKRTKEPLLLQELV